MHTWIILIWFNYVVLTTVILYEWEYYFGAGKTIECGQGGGTRLVVSGGAGIYCCCIYTLRDTGSDVFTRGDVQSGAGGLGGACGCTNTLRASVGVGGRCVG